MRPFMLLACLGGLIPSFASAEQPAAAQTRQDAFLADAPLSDSEMDGIRGGFVLEGVTITLGAELRTYLDGTLVLATSINWTNADVFGSQHASTTLTPASQAALGTVLSTGGSPNFLSSGSQVYLANGGQTALYQSIQTGIQNVLVNTAPGVSARQSLDATIGISGYGAFNNANLMPNLGQTLSAAVASATLMH